MVFVAHSMGGIILKQMLCDSSLSEGNVELQKIASSTTALVFLGTPHRGSDWSSWGKIAAAVAAAALFDIQKANIRHLDAHEECLSQLEQNFARLIYRRTFKIHSFQESKGMFGARPLNAKVVENWSSQLGDPGRERLEPINANHMDMCRFVDRSDPGYQQVGIQIKELVEEAQFSLSRTAILASLRLPNVSGAHVSDPHDHTCSWIHQHDGYQHWLKQRQAFFCIKWKAGCGKSTLVKYLWLEQTNSEKSDPYDRRPTAKEKEKDKISAAFFFNARGTNQEQKSTGLYKTLLFQILDQVPAIYRRHAQQLEDRYQKMVEHVQEGPENLDSWGLLELKQLFKSIFTHKGIKLSIILFVDALDECEESEWDEVLSVLESCVKSSKKTDMSLSICFSSRPNPEIEVGQCQSLVLQDENHADIVKYVQTQLGSRSANGRKTDYYEKFANQVIEKADGVFLWVSLVVPKLRKAISRGDTLKRLGDMLNEIPAPLEQLFEHILQKLNKDTLLETVHILRWTLFSDTNLNLDQFRHTFVAQPNCPCATLSEWETSEEYIEDSRQMEQQIESRCGGLVEVLKDYRSESRGQRARLFLEEDKSQTSVLSAPPNDQQSLQDLKEFSQISDYENPLTRDSQFDFGDTMKPQVQMIHQTAKQFFIEGGGFKRLIAMVKESSGPKMLRAFEFSLSQHQVSSGHDYLARSCAHYLTLPELKRCAETVHLGKLTSVVDSATYPLAEYAAKSCFWHAGKADAHGMAQDHLYKAFRYLSNGAFEILLNIAAENNISSWVSLLKDDKVDFDTRQTGYGNPIKTAVRHGYKAMVSVLIDCGSDVDGTEGKDQSTLSIAYANGDREMIDLLTAKGARISATHRVDAATTEQESSGMAEGVVGLLQINSLFERSLPSRVSEV